MSKNLDNGERQLQITTSRTACKKMQASFQIIELTFAFTRIIGGGIDRGGEHDCCRCYDGD